MNFKKDHVRLMPGATTLFLFFACFCTAMVQAQTLPATLEDGSSSDYKELHIGNLTNQGVEVNGVAVRFTGDFDTYPPDSMSISFPSCWFNPAAGNAGIAWEYASDSSYVDLEVWDTSSGTYSGYGMFLQFYKDGGIGSLDLDDLLKTSSSGLAIESVRVLKSPGASMVLYPNPANSGQAIQLSGLASDSRIQIASTDGKVVANLNATSSSMQLPNLKPGVYIVSSLGNANNLEPQVKKVIVY